MDGERNRQGSPSGAVVGVVGRHGSGFGSSLLHTVYVHSNVDPASQ